MTRASSSETPTSEDAGAPPDRLRLVLDDATADRLRDAADRRQVVVEALMADLLRVASHFVDEVLAMADDINGGDDAT